MTTQERIDRIVRRLVWADQRISTLTQQPDRKEKDYKKSAEEEVNNLLEQALKENNIK